MLKWDYEITCATSNALTMQHAFDIRYSDSDPLPFWFWLYYNLKLQLETNRHQAGEAEAELNNKLRGRWELAAARGAPASPSSTHNAYAHYNLAPLLAD